MQCFYLAFSRGLEKYVYDAFGRANDPAGDFFYPDAYSLLFTAAGLEEAKKTVRAMFPASMDRYDRYLLLQVMPGNGCDCGQAGLECRQWLERHGI